MTNDLIGKRGASIKKDMTVLTVLTGFGEKRSKRSKRSEQKMMWQKWQKWQKKEEEEIIYLSKTIFLCPQITQMKQIL